MSYEIKPILFAFDPGARSIAWARFECARLVACGYVDAKTVDELQRAIEVTNVRGREAVIELPQVYQQRAWKGDPNDLIAVAVTVGRIAAEVGAGGLVRLVRPHGWKGSTPKDVMTARIESKLLTEESKILHCANIPRAKRHNAIDAIGLGLWALGRLAR